MTNLTGILVYSAHQWFSNLEFSSFPEIILGEKWGQRKASKSSYFNHFYCLLFHILVPNKIPHKQFHYKNVSKNCFLIWNKDSFKPEAFVLPSSSDCWQWTVIPVGPQATCFQIQLAPFLKGYDSNWWKWPIQINLNWSL